MGQDRCHSNSGMRPEAPLTKLFSWTLLLACLSVTGLVSSQAPTPPPNPEKEIQITHRIENGNAILSCIVRDLGRRRIIWSRLSDPYPISVGTLRFHPDRKYRVVNQANTNVLTISRVGLADAGEYQCRVSGAVPLNEVISLNIQSGPRTTYFLPTNRSMVSATGMTVIIPCEVENLNTKMVMWKDGRNNLLTLRKRVYNGDSRISVLHRTRPEWHLKIDKLAQEDFGYYTCVVNSDPVLTRTIQLINNEPPKVAPIIKKDTNFRKKVTVMVGETVTLTCNFHSYPPATVKWYKRYLAGNRTKKQDLGAEGNEYTLRSVSLQQAGDYVCIGRNGMEKEGKARTRLIVNAPPTTVPTTVATTIFVPTGPSAPHVYHEQRRVGQKRGRNVELTCFAIGQPRPNIHWVRHGGRIVNDHKYKVTSESRGRYTTHSTLLLRSVSSRDYGTYECVSNNQLGLKRIPVELYELKM